MYQCVIIIMVYLAIVRRNALTDSLLYCQSVRHFWSVLHAQQYGVWSSYITSSKYVTTVCIRINT